MKDTPLRTDAYLPDTLRRNPSIGQLLIRYRRPIVVAVHVGLIVCSSYAALSLRFDGDVPPVALRLWLQLLPWLVIVRVACFLPLRLFEGLWRYTSAADLRDILIGVAASSVALFGIARLGLGLTAYPRSAYIVDASLLVLMMGGIRLLPRLQRELGGAPKGRRVLVVGAGDSGERIVRDMLQAGSHEYHPVAFVDDDPAKRGRRIRGVTVAGTIDDLPSLVPSLNPDDVLIAMPQAGPAVARRVVEKLDAFKVPLRVLPTLTEIVNGNGRLADVRDLSIEDLLSRPAVGLDCEPVRALLAGRTVMVTGAGGSIGSELCRQILQFSPHRLLLYERHENSLYTIAQRLLHDDPMAPIVPLVADVQDANTLTAVLVEHRPDIIFHAAAHKHVPLMQTNVCEAARNNVGGTWLLADLARRYGVGRLIFISSDKAVNPTSVMGATKRVGELIVQALTSRRDDVGHSVFAAVRFGNVLGSNGSVVPLFLQQIRNGGPVTVTHPEVQRYFMLPSEAVQLVLHAAAQAQGGEVFVLDMGEQIKLLDLARTLIRLSGFVPDRDVRLTFTGLRPGEKLSEELVGPNEAAERSPVDKILRIGRSDVLDRARLGDALGDILDAADRADAPGVLHALRAAVPTFEPAAALALRGAAVAAPSVMVSGASVDAGRVAIA